MLEQCGGNLYSAIHGKPVPDMTYNVFGGTLSLNQSISQSWQVTTIIINTGCCLGGC